MTAISNWVNRTSRMARVAAAAGLLSIAALMALMPLMASARGASREIVLVARQMAFYVEGGGEPNPTLVVRPGEEVRIVLKNQEPGVFHDLKVGGVNVSVEPIRAGATATLTFRAPDRPGRYEYVCRPHAQMMTGVLLVARQSGSSQ
jgi:plastocyanin